MGKCELKITIIIALGVILLSLLATWQTEAAPTKVCASVELPKPGKCTHMMVEGYKVRVCRP